MWSHVTTSGVRRIVTLTSCVRSSVTWRDESAMSSSDAVEWHSWFRNVTCQKRCHVTWAVQKGVSNFVVLWLSVQKSCHVTLSGVRSVVTWREGVNNIVMWLSYWFIPQSQSWLSVYLHTARSSQHLGYHGGTSWVQTQYVERTLWDMNLREFYMTFKSNSRDILK